MRIPKLIRRLKWQVVRGGPGRRSRTLTVATANGLLSFPNTDVAIAKTLYIRRSYELELMSETISYLRANGYLRPGSGDVVVDVGANIGMTCIALLKHAYFRQALAFEPCADNFTLLERNIRQNGMEGAIRAYRCALSDMPGERIMERSEDNCGDNRLRSSSPCIPAALGEDRRRCEQVPVRTLDEVLAADGTVDPGRIGLVWVDIQGHEGQFFNGARRTLARGIPVVSEFWPYGIRRGGLSPAAFTEIVSSVFTHLVHVDTKSFVFQCHDVRVVPEFFSIFGGPEDFQQIIFLSARGPTSATADVRRA